MGAWYIYVCERSGGYIQDVISIEIYIGGNTVTPHAAVRTADSSVYVLHLVGRSPCMACIRERRQRQGVMASVSSDTWLQG